MSGSDEVTDRVAFRATFRRSAASVPPTTETLHVRALLTPSNG
jgi:hypothetical protein